MGLCQISDGIFRIPKWLEENFSSFEYGRKITLTTCLQKARRGRESLPFSLLIRLQYLRFLINNIYHSNKREPRLFFHLDTNTWSHPCPYCWQNPCSGCNSGTDLVVVLEYIFFQLCCDTEQISQVHKIQKKLCKSQCCRSNQPLSKLHCFFAWCALFKVATFLFFFVAVCL